MRKVSRKDCIILPLVLKKRWYDMIDSGEKKEEYREHKEFWTKRIEKWQDSRISELIPHLEQKTDVIAFSCGYRRADMFFICARILIKEGSPKHPEWGEPATMHYVIKLGERVNLED